MARAEQGAIAEDNKKAKFLEETLKKHQEKKERQDYFEDERRKKAVLDRQEELR